MCIFWISTASFAPKSKPLQYAYSMSQYSAIAEILSLGCCIACVIRTLNCRRNLDCLSGGPSILHLFPLSHKPKCHIIVTSPGNWSNYTQYRTWWFSWHSANLISLMTYFGVMFKAIAYTLSELCSKQGGQSQLFPSLDVQFLWIQVSIPMICIGTSAPMQSFWRHSGA